MMDDSEIPLQKSIYPYNDREILTLIAFNISLFYFIE